MNAKNMHGEKIKIIKKWIFWWVNSTYNKMHGATIKNGYFIVYYKSASTTYNNTEFKPVKNI